MFFRSFVRATRSGKSYVRQSCSGAAARANSARASAPIVACPIAPARMASRWTSSTNTRNTLSGSSALGGLAGRTISATTSSGALRSCEEGSTVSSVGVSKPLLLRGLGVSVRDSLSNVDNNLTLSVYDQLDDDDTK